jgi:hypothetical protein
LAAVNVIDWPVASAIGVGEAVVVRHINHRPVAPTEGRRAEASDAVTHRVSADIMHDEAFGEWQEIRDRWRSHVVKVREYIRTRRAEADATEAVENAGMAESYARQAIEFTLDAVDEAEEVVLDALQARATANALVS